MADGWHCLRDVGDRAFDNTMTLDERHWNFPYTKKMYGAPEPYCDFCKAAEWHTFGWCYKHQRFECIVQRTTEDHNVDTLE